MNAYCKLGSAAICNDIAIQACQRRRGGGTYSGLGGERVDHGSRHRRAELADGSAMAGKAEAAALGAAFCRTSGRKEAGAVRNAEHDG